MRKLAHIVLLAVIMTACVQVPLTNGEESVASFITAFNPVLWPDLPEEDQEGEEGQEENRNLDADVQELPLPELPDSHYVAWARTTNTIHGFSRVGSQKKDTLKVFNGDYHCVTFGFDTQTHKNAYEFMNAGVFIESTSSAGLMDLYAALPVMDKDDNPDQLFRNLYSEPYPVVDSAANVWIGSSRKVFDSTNIIDSLVFDVKDYSQRINVQLRIVISDERVKIERVAAALVGVPRRIKLLDQTVGQDSLARTIFELHTTDDSLDRIYTGTTTCLGLLLPYNNKILNAWGVLEVAVQLEGAEKPEMASINLYSEIAEAGIVTPVGLDSRFRITRPSTDLIIKKTVHLDISVEEVEESNGMDIWVEDPEQDIDVIPEDPE